MARSTPVIATVGASLLVVAIAAAAIRGTDDSGQPSTQPTVAQTATTDDPDTTDVTPSPTETASPTEDVTSPDDVEPEGTPAPTETDDDQTGTDDGDGTDGTDGDSGDDLPETGGGGLALLGAALAVAGATGGLRHRTT